MKHLLITTIAAVLVVGCGPSEADKVLLYAASKGHIKAVKHHLEAGADVNAQSDGGVTPLHGAVMFGHNEIVELLIAEGADVNAKAEGGSTPLQGAVVGGSKEIVELLIVKGADVNAKSNVRGVNTNETPLDMAIINKQAETADLLRKHGGKTGEELKAEGK